MSYTLVQYLESGHFGNVKVDISNFPDGTVGVKVVGIQRGANHFLIKVQGYEANQITILTAIMAAVRRLTTGATFSLALPYLPNARYDRGMLENDAPMLKLYAKQLNALGFGEVFICDPHSTVAENLIENVEIAFQDTLIDRMKRLKLLDIESYDFIVAPDMGAVKKAQKVADRYKKPVVCLNKVRDMETGNITGLEILGKYQFSTDDKIIIIDDLCDGGRTFIESAKILKAHGAGDVDLFVTHGIFSQGIVNLLDNGISKLYCTNSFSDIEDERVVQLDVIRSFA